MFLLFAILAVIFMFVIWKFYLKGFLFPVLEQKDEPPLEQANEAIKEAKGLLEKTSKESNKEIKKAQEQKKKSDSMLSKYFKK